MTSSSMEDLLDALAAEEAPAVLQQAMEEGRQQVVAELKDRFAAALRDQMTRLAPGHHTPAPPLAPVTARHTYTQPSPADPEEIPPATGWYIYGLTWTDAAGNLAMGSGVAGFPIQVVTEGDVTAVVSPIDHRGPWGVDGAGQLDLEQLAPRAREHEEVLEEMLELGPVLPMRFGVMYPSLDQVTASMREQSAELQEALSRLEGHAEWSLVLERRLKTGSSVHPRSGHDYLNHRLDERRATRTADDEGRRAARAVHERLATIATGSVTQAPSRSRRGTVQILRASYLLDRSKLTEFRRSADTALTEAPADLGLTGELTGPWPAYSFSELRTPEDRPA